MPEGNDQGVATEGERLRQRGILGQAAMLGTNVAAGMILCTLLGYYADYRRGTGRFWTLSGIVVGFLFSAYEFWKTVRELESLTGPAKGKTTKTDDGKQGHGRAGGP